MAEHDVTDPTQASEEEVWLVRFANDEIRALSLEALDAAYQRGDIDEDTQVLPGGGDLWMSLGEAASTPGNGGDAQPAEAPAAAPLAAAAPAQPRPAADRLILPSAPPPASVAPMARDLELDLDEPPAFRRKRGGIVAVACIAAAVLGLGVAAATFGGASPELPTASAASIPAATAVAPSVTTPSDATADAGPRFSEEQLKALRDADRAQEEKRRASARPASNSPHRAPQPAMPPTFHKGGNAHDPLNSAL